MHTRATARPVPQAGLARQEEQDQGLLRDIERVEALLHESEQRRAEDTRRLEALLRLNHDLAQAGVGASR